LETAHDGGLAPAEKQIEAGGLVWNYLEWNPGGTPHVLLVHGITSDARTWWKLGPDLAQAGAHVLAVDMPGHGTSSDTPTDVKWTSTAAQLAAFVEVVGWDKAGYRLAGHSWGGAVSLTLAAHHPAGLEKVALLDPALSLDEKWAVQGAAQYQAEVGVAKKSWDDYLAWTRQNMPQWTDSDRHWKAGALVAYRPEAVRDFFRDNSGQDITPLLGRVEAPLLLFISDEALGGVIQPPVQAAARAALKPGTGRAVRYEGVGHNIHREDYPRLLADLKPFLLNS
jgi:pimeloyl-ACP methyl ester carboxylesterase